MDPFIFGPLLLAVCLYAWWRGGADERVVAATCLAGTLATMLVDIAAAANVTAGVEEGLMLVDLGVLAGFITVALRSNRFWPLWVAGLQLTTSLGHILKGVDHDLLPRAYGAALQFWSYPILRHPGGRHVSQPISGFSRSAA